MKPLTRRLSTLLFGLLFSMSVQATIDQYDFDDPAVKDRFLVLIEDLRCPKCQNQNLADSNAEIAQDLRNEIYRLLDEGYTNQEIVDHLVARYGEFVRYKPPVNNQTLVLWLAPMVLLLLGALLIVFIVMGQRKKLQEPPVELSDEEREKLTKLTQEQE